MQKKDQETKQEQGREEQTAQRDENVLNPEIKNESDLSKKERRLIEKEKLKGMGLSKKLEYIWMYYKPAIFGVIAAIALVFAVRDYCENAKMDTVLAMSIVNCTANETTTLSQEIKEELGLGDDKYSQVEIGVNLTTNTDGSEFDYYAQMAYVTQVQAGSLDVIVMPEALYQNLEESGAFDDILEIVGEDTWRSFGEQTDTKHLLLTDKELLEKMGISYEQACIVIPVNAPNKENAAEWIMNMAES